MARPRKEKQPLDLSVFDSMTSDELMSAFQKYLKIQTETEKKLDANKEALQYLSKKVESIFDSLKTSSKKGSKRGKKAQAETE